MAHLFDLREKLTFSESLKYLSDAGFNLTAKEFFNFVLEKKIKLRIFSYDSHTKFTIDSISLQLRKQPYICVTDDEDRYFWLYVNDDTVKLTKYLINDKKYSDLPLSACLWDATNYYAGFFTEDIRNILKQAKGNNELHNIMIKNNKKRTPEEWCEIASYTQEKYRKEGELIGKGTLAEKISVLAHKSPITIEGWFNNQKYGYKNKIKSIPDLTGSIKNNYNGLDVDEFDLFHPKTEDKII